MKNLSLVIVAVLSLVASGCGKKSAGGADCTQAINHSMALSKTEMQKMGNDDKMLQKMTDLGIQHCKDDKWSGDAIKCMVDAKTMTDSQACYGKLTADQQQKMNKAAMELATPAGGGGAGGAADTGSAAAGSDLGSAGSAAGSNAAAGESGSGSAS